MEKGILTVRKRFLPIWAILLISADVAVAPTQASAGIVEFFFPTLAKKEPDPSETLRAPFAEPEEKLTAKSAAVLPENAVALDKPHRTTGDITTWVMTLASDAMTYDSKAYSQKLESVKSQFSESGFVQYKDFLTQQNILKVLESGRYRIHGFVEESPLLLNEGSLGGRYRWLYEVPVMISYLDASLVDYKKEANPPSQSYVLTVQIGRDNKAGNSNGIVVERWVAKVQKRKAAAAK